MATLYLSSLRGLDEIVGKWERKKGKGIVLPKTCLGDGAEESVGELVELCGVDLEGLLGGGHAQRQVGREGFFAHGDGHVTLRVKGSSKEISMKVRSA